MEKGLLQTGGTPERVDEAQQCKEGYKFSEKPVVEQRGVSVFTHRKVAATVKVRMRLASTRKRE